MVYRRIVAGALLFLAACSDLPHESPFDALAPAEKQARAELAGRIVLEGESDASQVSVELINEQRTYTVDTKADGEFRLTGIVPGTYSLTMGTRYFTPVTQVITFQLGERVSLGLLALKARTADVSGNALAGVLLNNEMKQRGGVTVTLRKTGSIRGDQAQAPNAALRPSAKAVTAETVLSAVSANDGSYQLNGVPAGQYQVEASTADILTQTMGELTVTGEQPASFEDFVLLPLTGFFTITGTVNGQPSSAGYTTAPTVTLTLSGFNAAEMKVVRSTNGTTLGCAFGAAEPYVATKQVVIPAEGTHLYCVRFVDLDARETDTLVGQITYDKTAPTLATLRINGGAAATTQQLVSLALSAVDTLSGVTHYKAGSAADLSAASPLPIVPNAAFALPGSTDAAYTVWVSYGDRAGNYSAPISAAIVLDTAAPVVVTADLTTPDGTPIGAVVSTTNLVLTSTVTDTPPLEMQVSLTGSFAGLPWEPYAASKPISLPQPASAAGSPVRVMAQVRDAGGHLATVIDRVFTLDTVAPGAPSIAIQGKGAGNAVSTSTVTVQLAATGSPTMVEISSDIGFFTALPPFSMRASTTVTLPGGEGLQSLYVRYYDDAGNVSAIGGDTVVVDTTGPQLASVAILDSDPTNAASLTVQLGAVGAANFRMTEGAVCGGPLQPYVPGNRVFTGYAGEGVKTVAVEYFDAIGNTSGCVTDTIYFDPNPPVALANPFLINMGSAATSANVVSLRFNVSGATRLRVSEDSSFSDTDWVPYTALKTFVLSAGNGAKRLYADVSDNAGNALALADQSIVLDTTPPSTPYLMISGEVTTATLVRLFLGAGLVQDMMVSENADFSGAAWWPYVNVTDVTVSNLDGVKTLYAKFRKSTGIETSVVSDTIVLDRAAPLLESVRVNGGASVVAGNVVTLNLSAVDETSGVAAYQVASANDFTAILPRTFQSNDLFSLAGTDGLKEVWVRYMDRAGNYSAAASTTVVLDTTAPVVGSAALQLPDGAPLTPGQLITSSRVFLVSSVNDASPLELQITYSGTFAGTSWEPYGPNRAIDLALPAGAGAEARSVKARVRDAAGHVVDLVDTFVNLDTRAPTGSVARTSPSPATTFTVTLTLSASEAPSQAQVSTDPAFAGAAWFATVNTAVVLPPGDGLRTLYVHFRDAAGNVSGLYSTSVEIDATPPQLTSFTIAEGALTRLTTVTLLLNALGATEVQVAENACGGTWFAYSASRSYTFASFVNETKTVAVRYRDAAGNVSPCLTRDVALDTAAPYPGPAPIMINGTDLYATARTVSLAIAATEATEMQISESMVFSGAAWTPFTTATAMALSAGEGAKTLYVRFRDPAGNVSAAGADSIVLDTIAPAFNALNGPAAASDTTVTLVLTATGADAMRLSENPDFSGAAWQAFASPTPFTFSAGLGLRNVYVQIADAAGNESIVRSLGVNVDTNAPASPIVAIVEGGYAKTALVNVQVFADAVEMQRSEDPAFAGATWEPFAAVKTFTLTGSDGAKTVYVRVKDAAGNVSPAASASVVLDTADPVVTLYQAEDAVGTPIAATNQLRFYLHLGVTDANPVTVQYATSSVFAGIPAEAAAALRPWDVLPPTNPAGESRSVWVKVSDAAGRSAVAGPVTVLVDTLGPTGATLGLAAATVSSPTVTVNLSAVSADWVELSGDIGFLAPARFAYLTVTAYTLSGGDGLKTVYARYADGRGNYSAVVAATALLDTQAPGSPSIRIDGGAAFVTHPGGNVNLALAASDTLSTVAKMKLANAAAGGCAPALAATAEETYFASKPWVLAAPGAGVEGARWVCAAFRDGAGNWSAPVSAAVQYDTKSPVVSGNGIAIAGGAQYSTATQVPLSLTASGAAEMQLVNGTSFGGAIWEPFRSSLNWLLLASPTEVERQVSVKFRDAAGNETAVYTDAVTLDTVAPTTPAIAVNGGAPYATNAVVTLTLSAFGASAMQISNDGNFDTEGVVPYATSTAWALPGVDGVKSVYVRFLDAAGNASPVAAASVILDRAAPQGADFGIDEAPRTPLLTIHLTLTATGASEMQISEGACNGTWVAYAGSAAHNFQSPIDGNKVIAVRFRDVAGNLTACLTKSITLDSTAPLITTMAPRAGAVGAVVTIDGLNFGATQGASQVTFGGVQAGVSQWQNASLRVQVPNFASPGTVPVSVAVGAAVSNNIGFIVVPGIQFASPAYGSAGDTINLAGSSFSNTMGSVALGGVPAMPTAWNPNTISVSLPPAARPGMQNFVVNVNGYPSQPLLFAVVPRITSGTAFVPAGGSIMISGQSFGPSQGGARAMIGGVEAVVLAWSSTSITALVPGQAPGGPVELRIVAEGVSSNVFTFNYARPALAGRWPALAGNGTQVAIAAPLGLSPAPGTATVDGVPANVAAWYGAGATLDVPAAARKGQVEVRLYDASGVPSNTLHLTKRGHDVWYHGDAVSARARASAVWSGTHMIVWGGNGPSNDGGRYSPATDTWLPLPRAGAPEARFDHTAVWTGGEMIVWGGCTQLNASDECTSFVNSGGSYNPATDAWRPVATPRPFGRSSHTAVWTGSEMLVFGGRCDNGLGCLTGYTATLDAYDPAADAWTLLALDGAPTPRAEHAAVWTGVEMLAWGGRNGAVLYGDGARYLRGTNTWKPMSSAAGAPSARYSPSAVWTGAQMILFGGRNAFWTTGDGSAYDPKTDQWFSLPWYPIAPRYAHTAVWTGSEMLIWGGSDTSLAKDDGFRYDPQSMQWSPLPATAAPTARFEHAAVWTGNELIVWSGRTTPGDWQLAGDGARWNKASNGWTQFNPAPYVPAALPHQPVVWTGSEMIMWGGGDYGAEVSTGSRYVPATDSWIPMSTLSAPQSRNYHSLVWTGSQLLVWGGMDDGLGLMLTARYSPALDVWLPMSNGPLSSRGQHSAVWNGTHMIVWGGTNASTFDTGALYEPVSDTWTFIPGGGLSARYNHTAVVVSGGDMIVWGGWDPTAILLGDGGRYAVTSGTWTPIPAIAPRMNASSTPMPDGFIVWGGQTGLQLQTGERYYASTNTWTTISTVGAPEPRSLHSAVFTGSDLIVWGGAGPSFSLVASGGRYDLTAAAWAPTTLSEAPRGRDFHRAVWAGDRMLVWGGQGPATGLATYFSNAGVAIIASVSAAYANVTTQVTLTGAWFGATQGASQVLVGGEPATIVSWSDTSITYTVSPDSPPGVQDVTVVVNGDSSNARPITVVPTFGALSASAGKFGDTITISGSGFGTSTGSVSLGWFLTADVVSWSSTQIVFAVPDDAGFGTHNVVVTAGPFSSNPQPLLVLPDVTVATPNPVEPWQVVTVAGSNLGYWPSGGGLTFDGQVVGFSNWSMLSASGWTQDVTAGTHAVGIRVVADEATDFFTAADAPRLVGNGTTELFSRVVSGVPGVLSDVDVALGFDSLNADMQIELRHPDGTWITLLAPGMYPPGPWSAWLDATMPTAQPLNQLRGRSPNGTWLMQVTDFNPLGGDATVNAWGLVLRHGMQLDATTSVVVRPAITNVDPAVRQVGRSVNLLGFGFGTSPVGNAVFVGATPAFIESWDANNISFKLPVVSAGVYPVTVRVNGQTSAPKNIEVTAGPPVLSSLSPDYGPSGTTVTLAGQNFGAQQSVSRVYFGAATATVLSWSSSLVQVLVPGSAPPGSVPVVVQVGYYPSNALPFEHESAIVYSRYPHAGTANTLVTLTGARFGAAPGTAIVGGVGATIDAWSDTLVQIRIPAGTPKGYQAIRLQTAGGDQTNAVGFIQRGSDVWIPMGGDFLAGRSDAAVAWTGAEMLVWGGRDGANLRTGARYNPLTDTWLPITPLNAPNANGNGTAVWTGMDMIVWFGSNGGRYFPASDAWLPISNMGAPSPRGGSSTVWADGRMLTWGGRDNAVYLNDGGEYIPSYDVWFPIPATGAPIGRVQASAAWTGAEMLVWGGQQEYPAGMTIYNDGAKYNPASKTWTPISMTNAPAPRLWNSAVWSGSELIVWGGIQPDFMTLDNTGGRYNPVADTWAPVSNTNAPIARVIHLAQWTNQGMFIWGGCTGGDGSGCTGFTQTGGLYDPVGDSWTDVPVVPQTPAGRIGAATVWTGSEVLVWGGDASTPLDTGARFNPAILAWAPIAGPAVQPSARSGHSAAWTGSEMLVWGGCSASRNSLGCISYTNTGARYRPLTDDWIAMSTASAPQGVTAQAAVWTGSDFVTWGGWGASGRSAQGGIYDPSGDSWTPIGAIASARMHHTAVWTGSQVVFWGGYDAGGASASGVRLDPASGVTSATAAAPLTARGEHAAGWLGNSAMLVWGGSDGASAFGDGALYYPATNTWGAMTEITPPPTARSSAAYTTIFGSILVVWGGADGATLLSDGAGYDLATGEWYLLNGAPLVGRKGHSLVQAGQKLVIWGGFDNAWVREDGATFDLNDATWKPMAMPAGIGGRGGHTAVWTGADVLIWGGGSPDTVLNSGARYVP